MIMLSYVQKEACCEGTGPRGPVSGCLFHRSFLMCTINKSLENTNVAVGWLEAK